MNSTLNNTFALYTKKPGPNKCADCGATENLSTLYITAHGTPCKICKECRKRQTLKGRRREEQDRQKIAMWEQLNKWEES